MKPCLLIAAFCCLLFLRAGSQTMELVPEPDTSFVTGIYTQVDQRPDFPKKRLNHFLGETLRYPEKAHEAGIEGMVVVRFVVRKDGRITDPVITKSAHWSLDKEVLRLLGLMPRWEPARQNGVPVDAYFWLPVTFRLD